MLKHINMKKFNIVNTLPRTPPKLNSSSNDLPNYPLLLIRTYKASCPLCNGRSETINPYNRIVICNVCNKRVCRL